MPRTGQPSTRRVAAVERALDVLEALGGGVELGTNELARRTGVSASTASRVLATLAARGFVEHVPASGRYRLGLRLLELGDARLDLREAARPHLRALVERTGETATLSVPGEGQAITVDFVLGPASVQSVARVGRPSVPHATAAGKVMLAFGGAKLPRGRLRAYTSRTIVDRAALEGEIERVRARGWAEAVREREEDLSALAAPVFGRGGELAAILGLQGPAARFGPERLRVAVPALLERTRSMSAALGWSGIA